MDPDDEIEVVYDEGDCDNEFIGDDDISIEAVTNVYHEEITTAVKDYHFEILSPEQLVQYMLDFVKEVNSFVEIPATTTRILLHHFKWDKQRLMEKYYDGDQEKLFAEAHVVNPSKTQSSKSALNSSHQDCGICFITASVSVMTGLECGHRFCKDCWNDYLTTKIMEEGIGQTIACAAHKCDILVDDISVMNLVKDPKVKFKYQQLITNSFVECNKFLRWCPIINCNHAIKVQSVEAKPITCKCKSTFCFVCGDNWHEPINCDLLRQWIKQCEEDAGTSTWIAENTKDCPNCNVTIEKNGGCNTMICRKCQKEFCWLCLHPTPNRSHNCTKYKVKESSREALERFVFYNHKYRNYQESLKLESGLYANVKQTIYKMQKQDISWMKELFLQKAVNVLRTCRQTLMYTYAFAFYLKKTNQTEIFEDNQKDLGNSVEILSGYLERNFAKENVTKIKQKVQDMCCYCESRRKVLLEHVQEGNDKDWWELIKL